VINCDKRVEINKIPKKCPLNISHIFVKKSILYKSAKLSCFTYDSFGNISRTTMNFAGTVSRTAWKN
jgi:hypothetical protein